MYALLPGGQWEEGREVGGEWVGGEVEEREEGECGKVGEELLWEGAEIEGGGAGDERVGQGQG